MPTFYIEQFGCRATQADGAALEVQLLQRGYTRAAKDAADIVVVNTCTVTAAADAQARDSIRKISAQNHAARVIVTGCYAQRAPEEVAQLPGVAWVVGNSHKPELPAIIENLSIASTPKDFVPVLSLQLPSIALAATAGTNFNRRIRAQTALKCSGIQRRRKSHSPHAQNSGRLRFSLRVLRDPASPRKKPQPASRNQCCSRSTNFAIQA